MLRWAADIADQRDQRSQHAGQPAPAAEDTARVQANRAAVAANEAYKAGDLDRAEELTQQAAALDPSRAGLWQQHRNDIAARRLITAARAAHADADHERAGKLLQDARKLDPRLRTLWDGGLPAQPATQPSRPGPGPGSTDPETHGTGGIGRPAAAAQPGERAPQSARPPRLQQAQTAPSPRRRGPPGRSQECSILLAGQVRANHGQRHRPARRTLTRMRAMTPPAGRHPAPRARRRQRPGPRRLTAERGPAHIPAAAPINRARPEQAPGQRRTGGTRFCVRPGSRGGPARAHRPLPSTGPRRRPPRRPESSPAGDAPPPTFSEPLFGEDWWVADKKLFEDSLFRRGRARRAAPAAPPARVDAEAAPGGRVLRSRTCCRGSAMSRAPPTVNQYGEMARRHWARWLPDRFRDGHARRSSSPSWGRRPRRR